MSDSLPKDTPDPKRGPEELSTASEASVETGGMRRIKHNKANDKGGRGVWVFFFFMLLVISAAAYGFLWLQIQELRRDVSTGQNQFNATRDDMDKLNTRLLSLDDRVSDEMTVHLQGVDEALQSLRNKVESSAEDWLVGEAEYLLHIANNRLLLEQDVRTAISAMETADRRLGMAKDPTLLQVRRVLSAEINALRNVDEPDYEGIALALDALANSIDALPLLGLDQLEEEPATLAQEQDSGGLKGLLREIWTEIKSLMVIKRKSDAGPPLLLPDERYFLRQNLRLQLENAETALLRRNGKLFQSNIHNAQEWINRYFDVHDLVTAHTLDTLKRLSTINIAPKLPAISGSLEALQEWSKRKQAKRQRGTSSP